jgi:NAD-dependent DNA ligase
MVLVPLKDKTVPACAPLVVIDIPSTKIETTQLASCPYDKMSSEDSIVEMLKAASDAYYNGGNLLMDDDTYDALRDKLQEINPHHPYLNQIGAPLPKGAVGGIRLPYKMPSLNKIKPGTGQLESFVQSSKKQEWILTEKLDGISVLWDLGSRKLYLRGDGRTGVDISSLAPYITGLLPKSYQRTEPLVLRGELVVYTADVPVGTLPRSWINGLVHQKAPDVLALKKLRFVAYEVVEPTRMLRLDQNVLIERLGFELPWGHCTPYLADELLSRTLIDRRSKCLYAMDGIVIAEDCIPQKDEDNEDVSNPKDMRAFKMTLDDQKATTHIVQLHWGLSYQKYWIPRIQIQPVLIGGSRIEYLSGHNARFILQNKLGKGATITIRKSGDVIPTLESVLIPSMDIPLPEGVWDGDTETASHLKMKDEDSTTDELLQKRLEHFADTLNIAHLGPGQVAKLIKDYIRTPKQLCTASLMTLTRILGAGMGTKVYNSLQAKLQTLTELDLMIASAILPRGVGAIKLKALFSLQSDPRLWKQISSCEGWSQEALQSFFPFLDRYAEWRTQEFSSPPYPVLPKVSIATPVSENNEVFCFTGFRSVELQKELETKGHEVGATLTKKTTVLVVPDLETNSEKLKKAREMKTVRILTREDVSREYI